MPHTTWSLSLLTLALLTACTTTPPAIPWHYSVPEQPEAASGSTDKPGWAYARQAVAAANPLATDAGHQVLRAGGSALDAAIAVQMVLGLVEPQSSGIGGGAFLLHFDGRQVTAHDGRETAPAGARADQFLTENGQALPFDEAVLSGRSVGVPGAVRMLEAAHRQHGRLPWARLLEPAIALAEQGFKVSPRLHTLLQTDPHLGVFGVAQHMAHGPGLTLRVVEIAGGQWVLFQVRVGLQQGVQAGADLETLLGQGDGRLQQARPRQAAVLAVRGFEHAHGTRHTHRAAAEHRLVEGQGLAVFGQKLVGTRTRRGGFAPIVGRDLPAVKVQQEGAAPNAAGLRLHQPQHHLHRNGRVEGGAARAQDLVSGIGGQRVGRRHRLVCIGPARLVGAAAGGLRLLGHAVVPWAGGGRGGAGGQQRQGDQAQGLVHARILAAKTTTGPVGPVV